jgi:hypothetical protein
MAFGSSLIVDLDKQERSDRVPPLVAAGVAAEAGASVDRSDVVRPGTSKAKLLLRPGNRGFRCMSTCSLNQCYGPARSH